MAGAVPCHAFFQPAHRRQLRQAQDQRHVKNDFEPERFHQRAAAEQGEGVRGSPDDVVGADRARQGDGVTALADQRLDGRPQEAHADVEQAGGDHHAGGRVELRAGGQGQAHHAETDFERGEIAVALGEPSGLPGGDGINQAVQRGKGEVALVAKAKLVPHQKINVIGIKGR